MERESVRAFTMESDLACSLESEYFPEPYQSHSGPKFSNFAFAFLRVGVSELKWRIRRALAMRLEVMEYNVR